MKFSVEVKKPNADAFEALTKKEGSETFDYTIGGSAEDAGEYQFKITVEDTKTGATQDFTKTYQTQFCTSIVDLDEEFAFLAKQNDLTKVAASGVMFTSVQYDADNLSMDEKITAMLSHGKDNSQIAKAETIATAFKIEMNRLGLPCNIVNGELKLSDDSTILYTWNQVCVDGIWYNVDLASDLVNNPLTHVEQSTMNYVMLSDEKMAADHIVTDPT